MRVIVTGATGFIGSNIATRLHQSGHEVIALVRNPDSPAAHALKETARATLVPCDIPAAESFAKLDFKADALIHLVGIICEVRSQTYDRVHVQGTRNALALANKLGIKRFVQMSALGTRHDALARYHQTKWLAEQAVRESGLDWTIFRPSLVYGPGDGFVNFFERMSRWSPILPLIGGGRTQFQPVWIGTVSEAFVKSLEEPRSIGATLDLVGNDVLEFREILRATLKNRERSRLLLPIPWWMANIQASALEALISRIAGKPSPLTRDQITMLRENNVGNREPAASLLGLEYLSFSTGLRRMFNP